MEERNLRQDADEKTLNLATRRSELFELGDTSDSPSPLDFEICKGLICPLD